MTVIVSPENSVLGVFTDGDLRRTFDKQLDVHTTPMSAVMTRPVQRRPLPIATSAPGGAIADSVDCIRALLGSDLLLRLIRKHHHARSELANTGQREAQTSVKILKHGFTCPEDDRVDDQPIFIDQACPEQR